MDSDVEIRELCKAALNLLNKRGPIDVPFDVDNFLDKLQELSTSKKD